MRDLGRTYRLKSRVVDALENVNFAVKSGEFVVVRGESGSGKSTLLQLIGGLDSPTAGQVVIDGQDITKMKDRELARFRNRTIGFVFQNFYLQPFLSLRRNLELPAMFADIDKKVRTKHTETLAKVLGLSDRLDHLPRELSGGQIQRVAILRAIYNGPKVVLADEPTGNLDERNSEMVLELLKKVSKNLGATVVVATHDPRAEKYADKILNLKDGRLA